MFKGIFRHASVSKTHRHAVYQCLKRSLWHFGKIPVSTKFVSAILGPEMAAPILWTPGKNAFFLQEKPMSIKYLVLGGGGILVFFLGGGGSANFSFMGARIFLRHFKEEKPTPKTTHPNKKSLRKQFSGHCLHKPFSVEFIGVGGFLGWVFLPCQAFSRHASVLKNARFDTRVSVCKNARFRPSKVAPTHTHTPFGEP